MRKPRDIDAELKALAEKQRTLKQRKVVQLGELVVACRADALDADTLAGALLDAIERARSDASAKEAWRARGEAFFRRERRAHANGSLGASGAAAGDAGGAQPQPGGAG